MHYSYLDKDGRGVSKVHHSKLTLQQKTQIENEIRSSLPEKLQKYLGFGACHQAGDFYSKICYHCCQDRIQRGEMTPHQAGFVYYDAQSDAYGNRFDVCQNCITQYMASN